MNNYNQMSQLYLEEITMFMTDGEKKHNKEVIASTPKRLLTLDKRMVMIKEILTHQTHLLLLLHQTQIHPQIQMMEEVMWLHYQALQLKMIKNLQLHKKKKKAHLWS